MADLPPESSVDGERSDGEGVADERADEERADGKRPDRERADRERAAGEPASTGGGPRVVGVDSEEADALLGVLSSGTARTVLEAVHEEPSTASGLAERLDASLQTVHYHLRNLAEAGVVEVTGTVSSEKGREMDVYAPTAGPVVVFAGDEADGSDLQDALRRLASGFGVLAIVSLLVQEVLGGGVARLFGPPEEQSGDVTVAEATREAAGVEPGLVFFAGGAAVLLAGFALWYWARYRHPE